MTKRTKRILAMMSSKPKLRKISGLPPLTYTAKEEGTLKNYRIYGQTVDGESVGDRTGNLFDETIYNKNVQDNTLIYVPIYVGNVDYVTCSTTCPKTITGDLDSANSRYIFILSGNVNREAHNEIHGVSNGAPRTIQPSNGYVTIAYRKIENHNVRPWEYQTMLNEGVTPLPYEPYGYKVPMTVEGKNLFDYDTITHGYRIQWSSGANYADETAIMSDFISVSENSTYATDMNLYWICYDANKQYIGAWNGSDIVKFGVNAINSMTAISPCKFIRILSFSSKTTPISSTTMLNCGSTALPYEPYHAPITTPIYLPEPIKMVGDEAEYIEYGTQKMYRIGADDLDVTLPALPTVTGTNVLSVGTEVQPSEVEVTGRIRSVPTGGGE